MKYLGIHISSYSYFDLYEVNFFENNGQTPSVTQLLEKECYEYLANGKRERIVTCQSWRETSATPAELVRAQNFSTILN